MKFIQARIRGQGTARESRWIDLSPRLNLFHLPDESVRTSFLQTLAAVNPLFSCHETRPFADFPRTVTERGYTRKIQPEKRTVALAIFNSTPDLVKDLAALSPHLFETDRIEVGRRLDYSRWINFVEIASSTRWSEISGDMQHLLSIAEKIVPEKTKTLAGLIKSLKPSDRIKDGIDLLFADWLASLPPAITESSGHLIDKLQDAVRRADHFHAARRIIERRLPLCVVLTASPSSLSALIGGITDKTRALGITSASEIHDFLAELNHHLATAHSGMMLHLAATGSGFALSATPALEQIPTTPKSVLTILQAAASLAIAFSRVSCRTEPVLLFDSPERFLPASCHPELSDFILRMAEFCQCLYAFADVDVFPETQAITRYTASDLTKQQH
ncbi:MAG: hypothetical protein VR65_23395 [Desulfobulbaceae bacterium BRH_c16a]|nr:MAG: hypothetical protein VR65_23395 [Desulfobulbaceae bacterium BRH_c16a]